MKRMRRKSIATGIIFLFIILLSIPIIQGNNLKIKESVIENGDNGEWKTNYFCRINIAVDGASGEPDLGIGFIRYAQCKGPVIHCSISGTNGKDIIENGKWVHVRVKFLFGYTRLVWLSMFSEFYMKGFAIKCEYKVGKN